MTTINPGLHVYATDDPQRVALVFRYVEEGDAQTSEGKAIKGTFWGVTYLPADTYRSTVLDNGADYGLVDVVFALRSLAFDRMSAMGFRTKRAACESIHA